MQSRIKTFVMIYRNLILLISILHSIECVGQNLSEKINAIVHKYDSKNRFNGIIIVALNPNNILTFEYGYKDILTKSAEISMNDRFDLASLTKQFTGLAILQLMEKKLIHENDKISMYLPELKPKVGEVTIRQLANHTNGIHDFYSLTTNHDTLNSQKVLALLSQIDTTVFPAGTKWGYSNSGYFLLSTIIERVTNSSFQEYCYTNILSPLGMYSAVFAPSENVLKGFSLNSEPVAFNSFSSGESGLYATGNDMINFYKTVSEKGEWRRFFDLALQLSDKSNAESWNYGFGWYFTKDSAGTFRAHSGKNTGADTYLRWYDDRNLFICLLSNKRVEYFKDLREEISNLILSELK